ncbi:MAG: sugar nucleotide-binding protein [Candidatus Woesebacteria bacterium]|nr:sugar nucleotide-binding protein [Candidatus Woesebacteria bacterium]
MMHKIKKVLVIGATGLVGSRFMELSKDKFELVGVDEKILDITDAEAVNIYFKNNSFDSVLNFVAVTNVDGAEKEKGDETGLTWKINVVGPKNLAEECKKTNRFLVQISTDFVFKGVEDNAGPYSEDTPLPDDNNGIGWYGWTKNRAEVELEKSGARYSIARIAYPFYSEKYYLKLDFAKNYLKLYDEGKLFPIFIDQTLSVLNVDDLIDPLVKILNEEIIGTFHLVSSDTTTSFDFVEYLLLKARNVNGVVQKGSMKEFLKVEGRTPRPRLGGLKTEITQEKLGMKFKTWREMVDDFVASL